MVGGGGRAKGFGGPVAPALRSEFADGDGGGRTTPDECEASVLRAGVAPEIESLGDESAVALPPSECSLGICTRSLGLFLSICKLFVRLGGAIGGTDEVDCVRRGGCGGGCGLETLGGCRGWALLGWRRDMAATSIDCDRFSCLIAWISLRGGIILLLPQCAASMD